MISSKLNLSQDEFIIKRGSKNSMEVKDLSLRLTQASIMNGSLFYIEKGKP